MTSAALPATPLISVIIPVYNRAELVLRAIRSVTDDPSPLVEVVVVDDLSTDDTADHVARVTDPRVRLLRLDKNVGRCPARNRGAEIARGEWLVFLDSDDELAPGALALIGARISNADASVEKFLFSCLDDTGEVSPRPALDGRIVDYVGFLRYLESTIDGLSEALPCPRRASFLQCPYPEGRGWQEGIHELDFVEKRRVQLCPDVVRLYHFDAPVRVMVPTAAASLKASQGYAEHAEAMLSEHGKALRTYAPRRWALITREAALYNFFRGNRRKGIPQSLSVLRAAPTNLRVWMMLVAGTISPKLFLRLWTIRRAAITQ